MKRIKVVKQSNHKNIVVVSEIISVEDALSPEITFGDGERWLVARI